MVMDYACVALLHAIVTSFSCFVIAGSVANEGCIPKMFRMLHVKQSRLLSFFALAPQRLLNLLT